MIRLRLYKAIKDPKSCKQFIAGHKYVLESIGIKKVSSSNDEWMYNPNVFVINVEDNVTNKVLGGARVHIADKAYKLPLELAIYPIDPMIKVLINSHINVGVGEICGLWNSREVTGMGIGAVFLTRAAVAISEQLGLTSLFALCAPYTVKLAENVGYEIETSIGNNGTFYYPKLDLIATLMHLKDIKILPKASVEDITAILALRKNPNINKEEQYRNRKLTLQYQLKLN